METEYQNQIADLNAELVKLRKDFDAFKLHTHNGWDSNRLTLKDLPRSQDFLPPMYNATMTGTVESTDDSVVGILSDAATETCNFMPWFRPRNLAVKSLEFIWSSPAASGNGVFGITATRGGRGGIMDPGVTADFTVATGGAPSGVEDLNYVDFTLTADGNFMSALPNENMVGFQVTRTGGSANDTLNNLVRVYGILITYQI